MIDLAISILLITISVYFFVKVIKNVILVILFSILLLGVVNYFGIKLRIPYLQPITAALSYFFNVNLYSANVDLLGDNGVYTIFEIDNTGKLPLKLEKVYSDGKQVNFSIDTPVIFPNTKATLEVYDTNISRIRLVFDKTTVEKDLE